MGAVTDVVNFGDWRRMRMWLLAIAVAIAGAAALQVAGLIDLTKSIYTGAQVPWLSHVVGGFLFGFGMTLGSGCGSKTLIRVGAGNLKSLIVLIVLGVSAYMTLKGVFAPPRAFGLDPVRIDVRREGVRPARRCVGATAMRRGCGSRSSSRRRSRAFVFASREFRATREMIVGGIVVGAVIVGGWYVSGHVGYLAEDPATLEEKFVATNSGRHRVVLVRRAGRLPARAPDAVDRPVARAHVRHRGRARHDGGLGRRTRWSRGRSAGKASAASRTSPTTSSARR